MQELQYSKLISIHSIPILPHLSVSVSVSPLLLYFSIARQSYSVPTYAQQPASERAMRGTSPRPFFLILGSFRDTGGRKVRSAVSPLLSSAGHLKHEKMWKIPTKSTARPFILLECDTVHQGSHSKTESASIFSITNLVHKLILVVLTYLNIFTFIQKLSLGGTF